MSPGLAPERIAEADSCLSACWIWATPIGCDGSALVAAVEVLPAGSASRPLAPLRSGLPAIVPLGKRWLVKVMRALKPATGLECRAAFRAEASERGGGLGPELPDASAIPVASTAAIGRMVTAISLGVERRRSRFISCSPGIGWPQSGSPCLKDP